MADRQLLIIQILKIPVLLIKWGSKFASMLTYLPNYFIILLIDFVLFNSTVDRHLLTYIILWPIRLVILQILPLLFVVQFYLLYVTLQLSQKTLLIQIVAIFLALIGGLLLMRKGYLSFVQQFNPIKLKSPIQHAQLYKQYFLDFIGITLALLNSLLIINIPKTFSYNYNSNERNYLKYIYKLLRSSILSYIQFFYVKIFFKIFSWRYKQSLIDINKEMHNVIHYFMILTLLFWQTILDIVFIVLIGWIPLWHPQRKNLYLARFKTEFMYYRIVLQFNCFVTLQLFELALISLCIVKWTQTKQMFHYIWSQTCIKQNHLKDILKLMLRAALHFPYLFCLFYVYSSGYKWDKRQHILKNDNKAIKQWVTFSCFGQLIYQLPFFLLAFISTIIKPWNYFWLQTIIDNENNIKISYVCAYYLKSILDVFWFLLGVLFGFIMLLYSPGQYFQKIKTFYFYSKTLSREQVIVGKSITKKLTTNLLKKILSDSPHIGLYFFCRISFISIFGCKKPSQSPRIFEDIMLNVYKSWVKVGSPNYSKYIEMYHKDQAAGNIPNQSFGLRFWKFASKCQRYQKLTAILKFILPNKKIQKVLNKLTVVNSFSNIANHYWNTTAKFWALVGLLIYLIINAILILFGIFVMLPLALWRIPTFFIVFLKHRSKKYFYPIIFTMYKQIGYDIVHFLVHVLAFILNPRCYILYRIDTAFRYGPDGLNSFSKTQKIKISMLFFILEQSFKRINMLFKAISIALMWVRLDLYRRQLRKVKSRFLQILAIFFKLEVPSLQDLKDVQIAQFLVANPKYKRYQLIINLTNKIYFEAIKDLPYLCVLLVLQCLMPWRIFYVIDCIKEFRQGSYTRTKFFKLVKNCLKDYLCIIMNLLLVLSIVKAHRSIRLALKNYRLNFFVGFLDYSYYKELKKQLYQAILIYFNTLLLLIAMLFNLPKSYQMLKIVYRHYKAEKELEEARIINQKIHKNTVAAGQQLQILTKMQYNTFLSLCSYLTVNQLAQMSKLNKLTYSMIKQQQIWVQKWQKLYKSKYQKIVKGQNQQQKCKQAYKLEVSQNRQNNKKKITYTELIRQIFQKSVRERVELKQILKKHASNRIYMKICYSLSYDLSSGFEDQILPRDRENAQIRRLLGEDQEQIRRVQPTQRQQPQIFLLWLMAYPFQKIFRKPNQFFSVNTHRRKKQVLISAIIIGFIITYLLIVWNGWSLFWCVTPLIGIKLIFLIYFHVLLCLTNARCSSAYSSSWQSLKPFDIWYDLVNYYHRKKQDFIDFLIRVKNFIYNKILIPIKNAIIRVKNYIWNKIIQPTKNYSIKVKDYLVSKGIAAKNKIFDLGKKFWNMFSGFIIRVYNIIKGYVVRAVKFFIRNIAKPLYFYLSQKLLILRNNLILFFKFLWNAFKSLLGAIKTIIVSLYQGIKVVVQSLNNSYRLTLKTLMLFFIPFGILGELIFTLLGLILMCLPFVISWFFYWERWFIIISTIWTMTLIVTGYKHLNQLKTELHRR